MTSLDTLWWLVLGVLLGWIALWFYDKVFARDGEVAGMRAERELSTANQELRYWRSEASKSEDELKTTKSDLTAGNDQADVLRTELAVIGNERSSLQEDLRKELTRSKTLQREIESSRKLCSDRTDEINRMKQSFIAIETERDSAEQWAQGKEAEAAELRTKSKTLKSQLGRANKALQTATIGILAAQRKVRLIEARMGSGSRLVPKLRAQLTTRMRSLSTTLQTIDALAAADDARRHATTASAKQNKRRSNSAKAQDN